MIPITALIPPNLRSKLLGPNIQLYIWIIKYKINNKNIKTIYVSFATWLSAWFPITRREPRQRYEVITLAAIIPKMKNLSQAWSSDCKQSAVKDEKKDWSRNVNAYDGVPRRTRKSRRWPKPLSDERPAPLRSAESSVTFLSFIFCAGRRSSAWSPWASCERRWQRRSWHGGGLWTSHPDRYRRTMISACRRSVRQRRRGDSVPFQVAAWWRWSWPTHLPFLSPSLSLSLARADEREKGTKMPIINSNGQRIQSFLHFLLGTTIGRTMTRRMIRRRMMAMQVQLQVLFWWVLAVTGC